MASYDGHVAQYLGDGLLVYFGYPTAHEDDAQRAVRAGLGIVEAIRAENEQLERDWGVRLAVRVGIHTGLVVIGELGADRSVEDLAGGQALNVAARLQSLAEPDTILLSASTARLVRGYFELESLGTVELKGLGQAMDLYRAVHESAARNRLEAAGGDLTPLVARDDEVGSLLAAWADAQGGSGRAIALTGEAGIGKSRLVRMLLGLPPDPRYPPPTSTRERQKQLTIEILVSAILQRSGERPVLFVIEDSHWADPTTLELPGALLERVGGSRLLAIAPDPTGADVIDIQTLATPD